MFPPHSTLIPPGIGALCRALPLSPNSAVVAGTNGWTFCLILPLYAGVCRFSTGLPLHPILPRFCRRLLENSPRFCRSAAFTRLLRDHFFFFFGASATATCPHPRLGERIPSASACLRRRHRWKQQATPHRWTRGDARQRWHDQALTGAAPGRHGAARAALVCTAVVAVDAQRPVAHAHLVPYGRDPYAPWTTARDRTAREAGRHRTAHCDFERRARPPRGDEGGGSWVRRPGRSISLWRRQHRTGLFCASCRRERVGVQPGADRAAARISARVSG